MKVRLIALAALAAAGSAHALSPTDMTNLGADLKVIRIAGASAQTPMLASYLYNNICNKTTFDHLVKGSDHHAYSCNLSKAVGSYPVGTAVLVTKRDKGGSFYGVNPIAQDTAQETIVALNNCTSTGVAADNNVASYTCTTTSNEVAHAGIADVEPALFQAAIKVNGVTTYPNLGPEALGVPLTVAEQATLNVATSNQTIFGVAVSIALRNAMQTAQGLNSGSDFATDQPTITRAFYSAAAAGFLKGNTAGFTGWSALTKNGADNAKAINICRRPNGSGTQAASNMYFLDMGALTDTTKGAMVPLAGTTSVVTLNATPALWNSAALNVIENSGSGDVEKCLDYANTANAFAVGVISLEKDPIVSAKAYRFVKLDNVAPSQANARTGMYSMLYSAAMQYKTGALAADVQSFIISLRTNIGKPATIATLAAPAKNGVLASPYAWTVATTTCDNATGNDAVFGSCVERLDLASKYNYKKRVLAQAAGDKTNSAQSLHLVR